MAFQEVCARSGTDGSFLFSSSKEPWNTWFGLLFTTRCFKRAVEDSRAVLWATFKGSSDARLRMLVLRPRRSDSAVAEDPAGVGDREVPVNRPALAVCAA